MTPEQERDYAEIIAVVENLTAKCVEHPYMVATIARVLCVIVHDSNAEEMTLKLDGVTRLGEDLGNWSVTVKEAKP